MVIVIIHLVHHIDPLHFNVKFCYVIGKEGKSSDYEESGQIPEKDLRHCQQPLFRGNAKKYQTERTHYE
jgi:hypothetical protein